MLNKNKMAFVKNSSNVLNAGNYYIGDLCYFLPDPILDEVSSSCDSDMFINPNGDGFGLVRPYSGNGLYMGSNHFEYDVDEDNLGIVACSIGDRRKFTGCGTFHKFKEPVVMNWTSGVLSIKSGTYSLLIDTNDKREICTDDDGYDSWS
jgi:hypothetical protein